MFPRSPAESGGSFCVLSEVIDFGTSGRRDYENRYQDTDLVLYQKYTYEDAAGFGLGKKRVPLNIGGDFQKRQEHGVRGFQNFLHALSGGSRLSVCAEK